MRLVVGVHRCGRGARGYCRHLEQCCIKVRLLAAQLHHNWRTTRPHSATRCASTCETVPQVCAEPAVTIAHQSVKSTCPSRKVCASHFVKPERRRTSPARSPNSSASSCEDRGAAAGRASGVRHGQTDESAAPPWCGASKWVRGDVDTLKLVSAKCRHDAQSLRNRRDLHPAHRRTAPQESCSSGRQCKRVRSPAIARLRR